MLSKIANTTKNFIFLRDVLLRYSTIDARRYFTDKWIEKGLIN
jgi:hypothetical protein